MNASHNPRVAAAAAVRSELHDGGYRPVALYTWDCRHPWLRPEDAGKRPKGERWEERARRDPPDATVTPPEPDALETGILCDGLRIFDFDLEDFEAVARLRALAVAHFGETLVRWRDNSSRIAMMYRAAEGEPGKRVLPGKLGKIEVLGLGQQLAAIGTHPSGAVLRWTPEAPTTASCDMLPAITEAQVTAFLAAASAIIGSTEKETQDATKLGAMPHVPSIHGPSADPLDVAAALAVIPNDGSPDWEHWNRVGMATYAATGGGLAGFAAWVAWSERNPAHDPGLCKERWEHYPEAEPGSIGAGTLFHMAREARSGWSKPTEANKGSGASRKRGADRRRREASAEDQEGQQEGPANNCPLIRIIAGELKRIVDEAEVALIAADLDIYQRGTFIVRPGEARVILSDGRTGTSKRAVEVGEHGMLEAMTTAANWEKYDGRSGSWVASDAALKAVKAYRDRKGRWKLPVLMGIISAPTLRQDGTLLATPGYDRRTGLLLIPDGTIFPAMPEKPTKRDAEEALSKLRGLIDKFPFVGSPEDSPAHSVALSAFLTASIRRALPTAPMHAFSAPIMGSGKSMLVDLTSIIVSGREAGVIAQGKTEEEMEKRLGALLLAGETVIAIDNCEAPLGGEFLCQLLTQTMMRTRILGRSETPELPTNAFVTATANNLELVGDVTRRALLCKLDPKCERPELREFTFDPIAEAKARRGELLIAALTVLRAYHVAGRPDQPKALGSYEAWSSWVRGALIWCGEADPVRTMEEARRSDPKLGAITAIIAQWKEVIGVGKVTARNIIDHACTSTVNAFSKVEFQHPDFREVLLTVAGEGGAINSKRLGKWLATNKDRIVDGHRILQDGGRSGLVSWRLECVEKRATNASAA